jgi:hypothetical protein
MAGTGPADDVETALLLARARAIEAYANLEQSLSTLFAQLLGARRDLAGIVFFRIVSSRARNAIIEQLLRRVAPEEHKPYWLSLLKMIGPVDQQRNEIVHWHAMARIGDVVERVLTPPNFWIMNDSTPSYTSRAMDEFSDKCHFISRSLNMYYLYMVRDQYPAEIFSEHGPWLGIFQQEATYPPPDTHPLRPTRKTP